MENNEKLESSYVLFFIVLRIFLAGNAYQTLYYLEFPDIKSGVGKCVLGVIAIGHQ